MSEHSHIMGGSTALQRLNCPGSLQLEQKIPKTDEESDYAKEGSMLHAAMELCLTAMPANDVEAGKWFDELVGQDLGFGKDFIVTEEHIDEKLWPAWCAWQDLNDKFGFVDYFIEQRVSLERVVPGAFGTTDFLAVDKFRALHTLDWKFGDGVPVPVERNVGLGFYTAAALYDPDPEVVKFISDNIDNDPNGKVYFHIVQPRRGYDDDPLQTWETTQGWVEDLIDQLESAAAKAQQKNAPLATGSWCRWCDAKLICPEYTKTGNAVMNIKPRIPELGPVELATLLQRCDQLKPIIDEAYRHAQAEAERGIIIPGFKLVPKQARRKFISDDPKKDALEIIRKKRIPKGDVFEEKLRTPAQIEKRNKKAYKELSGIIDAHSSGVTLVPDSDKRPAVTGSMQLLSNAMGKAGLLKQETGVSKNDDKK